MKKVVFLVFSIVFLSCGKDSNLLDGKVTNASGEPVEGVLVQVMGTDLNSMTDDQGLFRINTRHRGDELIFTHPDYAMKRINIDDETEFSIKLTKKTDPEPKK